MTINPSANTANSKPKAGRRTDKPRRMARQVESAAQAPVLSKMPSKLDQVEALLLADGGASIAEIMAVTGWQQHSVRGAIAGALKKRGLTIASEKVEDTRRYSASKPA